MKMILKLPYERKNIKSYEIKYSIYILHGFTGKNAQIESKNYLKT